MAIIEISIGKSKYKIECPEDEKWKLLRLADTLDGRVKNLLTNLKNIDEKTLVIITALMIEDDLESSAAKLHHHSDENIATDKLDSTDLYEAISEHVENVADYVENLAKKIENY